MLNYQRVTVNVSKQYGQGQCLKFLWNSVDSKKDTPSRKRDQGMASVMASLKDMALLKVILACFSNGKSTSFYFCCALRDQQIQEMLLSTLRISSCAENRFFSAVSWVTLGSRWLATSPHPFQCMLLGSPTHGVLRLRNLGVLLFPKVILLVCYVYIYKLCMYVYIYIIPGQPKGSHWTVKNTCPGPGNVSDVAPQPRSTYMHLAMM